jgi:hypothetical protein
MQDSNAPTKFPAIWGYGAGGAFIRAIPTLSQIGVQNGAASFQDGFPPNCFVALSAGGAGPFGEDANGILRQLTAGIQWFQAGGPVYFDSAFSTLIGGYPKGAILPSATLLGLLWQSTADNNTTDPDAAGATNWIALTRSPVAAPTTYYVSSTGSDTLGNGSSSAPWQTIQKAVAYATNNLNVNGQVITLNVAGGTYSAGAFVGAPMQGQVDASNLVFTTSGPVTINGSGTCFTASGGAQFTLNGQFTHNTAHVLNAADTALLAQGGGRITIAGTGNIFGTTPKFHMLAIAGGSITLANSGTGVSYEVTGGGQSHWSAQAQGNIVVQHNTINIIGTPNFSGGWAEAFDCGVIDAGSISFTGSGATGPRFSVFANGVIDTSGTSPTSYLPGNVDVAPSTGGQYL